MNVSTEGATQPVARDSGVVTSTASGGPPQPLVPFQYCTMDRQLGVPRQTLKASSREPTAQPPGSSDWGQSTGCSGVAFRPCAAWPTKPGCSGWVDRIGKPAGREGAPQRGHQRACSGSASAARPLRAPAQAQPHPRSAARRGRCAPRAAPGCRGSWRRAGIHGRPGAARRGGTRRPAAAGRERSDGQQLQVASRRRRQRHGGERHGRAHRIFAAGAPLEPGALGVGRTQCRAVIMAVGRPSRGQGGA